MSALLTKPGISAHFKTQKLQACRAMLSNANVSLMAKWLLSGREDCA
ncbi:MAG: hypothetical protein KKE37_03535 [Verrucomicrobia bacterium]|nr:hypothetical protein [Verrucomicrobiota bacterium]MBU4290724.1 hypothetical protein [Verrucomicrobiota bacterium]MBU4428411.1 hypothetical protein [Verrucomicrobiota bacterium]MCG2680003.1 hypothetical protein [Kiritimatiellia bacterium]